MFERFTDQARTVVIRARATAAGRGDQIRPVYLLEALASAEGKGAQVLAGLGVDAATIERQEAKQSLALAIKEARTLRHTYLGDEHLLLGLPVQARQLVLDELRHTSA